MEGLGGDLKRKLAAGLIGLILVSGIGYQLGRKLGFWGQFGSLEGVTIVDEGKNADGETSDVKSAGKAKSVGIAKPEGEANPVGDKTGAEVKGQNPGMEQSLVVHIVGAVEKPGVYYLPKGSRIHHVVEKAVARKDAVLGYINLAQLLQDGEQVVVPAKKDVSNPKLGGATPSLSGGTISLRMPGSQNGQKQLGATSVNINTANPEQLDGLPGIGPALAQRIIEYRDTNGPFMSIQDLQKVPGIGAKKFEQLSHSVVIR